MKRGASRSLRLPKPNSIPKSTAPASPPLPAAQLQPALKVPARWDDVLKDPYRAGLESRLPAFLKAQRWFGGKAKTITSTFINDSIPVPSRQGLSWIALIQVNYTKGPPECYLLPLAFASKTAAHTLHRRRPHLILCPLQIANPESHGVLYDAIGHKAFGRALLDLMLLQGACIGNQGTLTGRLTSSSRLVNAQAAAALQPELIHTEQTNSALVFGRKLFLKFFRRLESGLNPDVEINQFLARLRFSHVPPLFGCLEFRPQKGEVSSVGMLSGFVPAAQDAWLHALEELDKYYDRVGRLALSRRLAPIPTPPGLPSGPVPLPAWLGSLLGGYLKSARLIGLRTAQMHETLASDSQDRAFAPVAFTPLTLRSLSRSMRHLARHNLLLLRRRMRNLPQSTQLMARGVAGLEAAILHRFQTLLKLPMSGACIRIHGDFHLGQMLSTGKDFLIVDFEGEPARSIHERRRKRSALRDVAGMLRSFHYAAHTALRRRVAQGAPHDRQLAGYEKWSQAWQRWIGHVFLQAYLAQAASLSFVPQSHALVARLLEAELLDKAIYELGYELNTRPDWVEVPLQAVWQLMQPLP